MKKLDIPHRKIEAVLFLENAFVSKKELSNKTDCPMDKLQTYIDGLNRHYNESGHAFIILCNEGNYLLAIKQELALALSHLYKTKNQQRLSKALLETLSVIAYSQPITKPEIDQLRGVNSDGAIKLLLGQNLIKIIGKKSVPGNPNQYGTTSEFLKTFGLKSIKDLPNLNEHDRKKFVPTLKNEEILQEEIEITEEMIEKYEQAKTMKNEEELLPLEHKESNAQNQKTVQKQHKSSPKKKSKPQK